MSWDEPAVLDSGAHDGGLGSVVCQDMGVADGGRILRYEISQIWRRQLESQEVGF